MYAAIASLALFALGLITVSICILSLVRYDGSGEPCDKTQCDSCPFPCNERHKITK